MEGPRASRVESSATGRLFSLLPGPHPRLQPGRPDSALRLLGQVAIVSGVVAILIAMWFMWGTGMLAARSQARLAGEFALRLDSGEPTTAVTVDTTPPPSDESVTSADWDDPVVRLETAPIDVPDLDSLIAESAPPPGEPLGRIVIPVAGVDWIVVEGTTPEDLRLGPGHVIGTAVPGQVGNAVISGHRTTYGSPFSDLDLLERGDRITITTLIGEHEYEVVETREILPTDIWIATQWEGSWLTLTTCTPRYFSTHRLIVVAQLVSGPNAGPIHAYFGPPIELPAG